MIDIHTHVLPEMDDGSKSTAETDAMLSALWQQGVTQVVATPHFYPTQDTLAGFLQRRARAFEKMPPANPEHPQVLLGAEISYFPGIGTCEGLPLLNIQGTKLLLIEMPFSPWSERMVNEICSIPNCFGLRPVLAHVNRYCHSRQLPAFMDDFFAAGVYFQCNTDAFLTAKHRRWALKMMKKGNITFLGSDCHNMDTRPPHVDAARTLIVKKLGADRYARFQQTAKDLFDLEKI